MPPSSDHSTVFPFSKPSTTSIYFSILASGTGPNPIVRRPVYPVEMPNTIRPGANALSVASAFAATGAILFDGIRTPAHNLMREVFTAAAPIATNTSALNRWVS